MVWDHDQHRIITVLPGLPALFHDNRRTHNPARTPPANPRESTNFDAKSQISNVYRRGYATGRSVELVSPAQPPILQVRDGGRHLI